MFLNCALVNSSLNSNKEALEAFETAFSRVMNNLRTLILSNAEDLNCRVLSPYKSVPCPGKATIGLTPTLYRSSLSTCLGLNANLVTFLILPLVVPAGLNHASATLSAFAESPAIETEAGNHLYLSLYLS